MDIYAIANAVIALLSPYLAKAGEEVAKQTGAAVWKKADEIHQAIKARFKKEKDDSPAQILEQFEKEPEKGKVAMQNVLIEILNKDPELSKLLLNLLREPEKAVASFNTQILGGEVGEIFNINKFEGSLKIDKRSGK